MANTSFKLGALIARNIKLYFKDKMIFFVSLITPMILIVLFLTFLGRIYETSLTSMIPEGITLNAKLIKGFTGGWLFSSIMATSCITVSFCSNMMVTDKLNRANQDFMISPVRQSQLQLSYTISNFITTFIVCFAAFAVGLIYLAIVGWYLSFLDIVMIILTMIITIAFGSILSSIANLFINSQGGLSAICTLLSSMYGFLCGAYMPLSQMSKGIVAFVSFIPGTYATVLFRQYYMGGALEKTAALFPPESADAMTAEIRKSFDGSFEFFGHNVPTWAMFLITILSTAALLAIYLLAAYLKNKKGNLLPTPKRKKAKA